MQTKPKFMLAGALLLLATAARPALVQTVLAGKYTTTNSLVDHPPLAAGEHFVQLPTGIKLHYIVGGRGPVCLLPSPGWGPAVALYRKSLRPLERHFTMVWYDTRASGGSSAPANPKAFATADFRADLEALQAHLGQARVWLAGHSMGGFQVLDYGSHHPDRVRGLLVMGAIAGFDSVYRASYVRQVEKRRGQPYYAQGAAVLLQADTTLRPVAAEMATIMPFYFHDPAKLAAFAALGDPQLSQRAWEGTQRGGFGTENLFAELKKITAPALVLVGDDDFICDQTSQAGRIQVRLPRATLAVVPAAGHFTWIEQPEAFWQLTTSWLKKQGL